MSFTIKPEHITSSIYDAFKLVHWTQTTLFAFDGVLKTFTKLKHHQRHKFTPTNLVKNGLIRALSANVVGISIACIFDRNVFPLITCWSVGSICNSFIKIVIAGIMYCIENNNRLGEEESRNQNVNNDTYDTSSVDITGLEDN